MPKCRNTAVCVSSQLDLFQGPCKQISQEKNAYIAHYPITTLSDNGPIEFSIGGSPHYTDLSDTRLYLRCKLVSSDGTDVTGDHDVGPVNMLFHALFRKVDVHVNQCLVTQSNDQYPFKAGLETLLNFGKGAKESQLESSLMYHKDEVLVEEEGNAGLARRKAYTKGSRTFEMWGPLHVDFFFQPKYMLDNVPIRIVLTRSSPNFYLQSTGADPDCKIVIERAVLFIRRVQVAAAVRAAHTKALQRCNALYPMHKADVELLAISKGQHLVTKEGAFGQKIPRRLVIVLLTGAGLNGGYQDSPFRYVTNVVTRVDLTLDGEPVADTPLSCDFENGLCLRAYQNMYSAINKSYSNHDLDITYQDFLKFYPIFCFDLTSDSCGNTSEHFELERTGLLRITLGLKNVKEPLYAILYGEFEGIVAITKDREVLIAD